MIRWGAGLAFLFVAWSATAASISGTYVGTVPNSTALVQLVQTNDRQVTGRWEITNLQPSGKLETNSFLVTGASDGTTVVLSLKPSALLSESLTLSGTVDGNALRLSGSLGGSTGTFILVKSDDAAYRFQVAILRDQSQQIINGRNRREAIERQARVRAELVTKINGLAPRVTSFSNDTPAMIGRFAPINQRYKSVTEWMMAAHRRQVAIYGDGQASVARGQIGVSIRDGAGQASQLHANLESSYQEVLDKVRALGHDLSEAVSACESPSNTSLLENSDVQTACLRVPNLMRSFQHRADELDKAFKDSERIWVEEHRKQDGIVRAADQAVR